MPAADRNEIAVNPQRSIPWGKIVGGLLLLLVGVAAYRSFSGEEKKIEYVTSKVEKKTVEAHVAATGAIESTTTVTVGSQVSGPVSDVLVDFNSRVEKGQVLAKIDPSQFLAQQARADASLQSANAGFSNAQANLASQSAAVQQAEVAIQTAQVNLQQAQGTLLASEAGVANARAALQSAKVRRDNDLVQYKRAEDLVSRELVALSERDTARTTYLVSAASVETAEAGLQQSQAQLAQTRAQLAGVRTEISAAQARLQAAQAQRDAAAAQVNAALATVAQAQAGVQEARVNLERTTITSPISGVVINRKVEPGQTVAAQFQAPELFTIARDLSKMQVKAEVSEADIGRVKQDAPVTFTVDAYPGREFKGSVAQVRSAPDVKDNSTSNVVVYGVLVTADNPDELLKPGMTATVEILAEKIKDATVIPGQALRYVPSSERPKAGKDMKAGMGGRARGQRGKGGASASPTASGSPSPGASATPGDSATPGELSGERKKLEPGTRRGVVWVLERGKPVKHRVVTGISTEDSVVVVSGDIKVGDQVITEEEGGAEERSRFRLSF